jgi:Domain of unknown function DUF11
MGGKRYVVGIVAVVAALLALPAAAQASIDLGVTQSVSAKTVKPGGTLNVDVTVSNLGTESTDGYIEIDSLGGHGKAADNPYISFSSSQGSCSDQSAVGYGMLYHFLVCSLGTLAPGQSATINAAVQINQTANHSATLLPNPYEGGYQDDNNSNNARSANVFLDAPPVVSGPKQLKIKGLPTGCVSGDFTLDIRAKAPHVKKVKVSASLGFDENGYGQYFNKTAKGNHLKVTFPASKALVELDKTYNLKVKARLKGGKKLKTTITYTRC